MRICGDYKRVNMAFEDNKYPLLTMQDLFTKLHVAHNGESPAIFSICDLSGAFNQIKINEESKKKSADLLTLNTHKGLYRMRRLAYGVKTAPSIFQATMDKILNGLDNTMCFVDDILIWGKNEQENLRILEEVFTRLRQHNVKLNLGKCQFLKTSVQYLGHIVSSKGIQPVQDKVEAIRKAPTPSNLTELQSFLGMVQYYGKFIPNLSMVLHPLYERLKADALWSWDSACDDAFNQCKRLLSSDTVLTHYDGSKPLILATDASPYGVGAVISHVMPDGSEKPIAYASRTLSAAEKNYSQIEREALAIVFGIKRYHQYLFARNFTLVTDHRPLTHIFGPKTGIPTIAASRMIRWALLLAGYQYQIVYKSSKDNANADALSRLPVVGPETADPVEIEHTYMLSVEELPVTAQKIAEATRKDKILAKVYDLTLHGWFPNCNRGNEMYPYFSKQEELSLENGCLLWGSRVIIPNIYRDQLLQELHTMHPGIVRMKAIARSFMWWPGLDTDIEDLVRKCPECSALRNTPPTAPLIPWPWATHPWQRIHIDFAEKLGHNFLIVSDSHSKWLEVIHMNSTTSSNTITELRKLFAAYGLPQECVSDNGPQFTSAEFTTFLKLNGVRHILCPVYHGASNGQAERSVQTLKNMLAKANPNIPLQHRLSDILFQYRNTPHTVESQQNCSYTELHVLASDF